MKLACFDDGSGPRCGLVRDDAVFDAAAMLGLSGSVKDVQALLEIGSDVLDRLASLPIEGAGIPLSKVRLLAPVLRPPTIRDHSVYEGHASMGGQWKLDDAWYRLPTFYFSNPLVVVGPDAEIHHPSASRKFDYELELAVVIGKEGRNVSAAEAMDHVAGFVILVDWSSRDLQRDEMQLHLGPAKGKDSANSIGPWLVTKDEVAGLWRDGQLHASAKLTVNGVNWVDGTTGGMQHDWPALIERASRDSRIVPGDVIGAGTVSGGSIPEGSRLNKPTRYLEPGDRIEVDVEGIGGFSTTILPPVMERDGYRFLPPTKGK